MFRLPDANLKGHKVTMARSKSELGHLAFYIEAAMTQGFTMHDIETTGNDNANTYPHIRSRNILPHQIADGGSPQQRSILKRTVVEQSRIDEHF